MGATQTVLMPSGRWERCAKPQTCRRHAKHLRDAAAFAHGTPRPAATSTQPHLREGISFAPIIVPRNPLVEPRGTVARQTLLYEYDLDRFEPDLLPGQLQNFEDLNRHSMVTNLRITHVDLDTAMGAIFDCTPFDIPKRLRSLAVNIGVNVPGNWRLDIIDGPQGEEIGHAHLNDKLVHDLRTWYFAQPNARDADGILAYCRGKGLDTTGLSPLAAIQRQLRQENPGINHPLVENAHAVHVANLRHVQVQPPRMDRLAAIEPRAAQIPGAVRDTGTPRIVGVVTRRNDRYRLIDGYHRYRHARELGTALSGQYIVLT